MGESGNIESQIPIESDRTVCDANSIIEGSPTSEKLTDIDSIEAKPQESLFYGGVQNTGIMLL